MISIESILSEAGMKQKKLLLFYKFSVTGDKMEMATALFEFCKIVLILMFAMGFVKIVPAAKKYLDQTVDEKKQEKIRQWALDAVNWAEDLLGDEDGLAKLNVVKEVMKAISDEIGMNLTEKQIDVLVRAAYRDMIANELGEFAYDEEGEIIE